MNKKKITYLVLIIVWISFIWANSLEPATSSSEQSHFVMELLNRITGIFGFYLSEFIVRKLAHMFEFFVLAFLTINLIKVTKESFENRYYVYALLFSMLIAGVDETIQLFIPGRAGMFTDVLIDSSGALIGLVLFAIYQKVKQKYV